MPSDATIHVVVPHDGNNVRVIGSLDNDLRMRGIIIIILVFTIPLGIWLRTI